MLFLTLTERDFEIHKMNFATSKHCALPRLTGTWILGGKLSVWSFTANQDQPVMSSISNGNDRGYEGAVAGEAWED
jgi:hypothetical protein